MKPLLRSLAALAWCVSSVTTSAAGGQNGTTPREAPTAQACADEQAKRLDGLVLEAEKKARNELPENVTTAEQARRYVPAEWAEHYRVLDHKGWWIVAYQGSGSEPILWFYGAAIRKHSRAIYRFGSW